MYLLYGHCWRLRLLRHICKATLEVTKPSVNRKHRKPGLSQCSVDVADLLVTNMSDDKAGCSSNYRLSLPLGPGCPGPTCRATVKV